MEERALGLETVESADALARARDVDLRRAAIRMPSGLGVHEIDGKHVVVMSASWGRSVLLGTCEQHDDSGGAPKWTWAVGVSDGKEHARPIGDYRRDILSVLEDLARQVGRDDARTSA